MDSGAIGVDGIQEKDVVLNLALAIQNLNARFQQPLDLYLTRSSDTLISLKDRSMLARTLKADIVISLHCNHSDNPKARVIEVYVARNESRNSTESFWFAYQLQKQIKKQLGFESRGVKFVDFQVLRETINDMPSVLLELGFLSSRDEGNYFVRPESLSTLALVIWDCLIKKIGNYEIKIGSIQIN